jgi:hypothetical protein
VDLILLILTLALVGFVLWLIFTYIPMPDPYKQVLMVIVVIVMILFLLRRFALLPNVL